MAWDLLISSDIGLLSLFTIGFILVMAVYLVRFAKRDEAWYHIDEEHVQHRSVGVEDSALGAGVVVKRGEIC